MQLKFRAFVPQTSGNNLYLEGAKWQFTFGAGRRITATDGVIKFEVDPRHLDLYTDFTDKNGKPIYSSDILCNPLTGDHGEVEMNDGEWQVRFYDEDCPLFEVNDFMEIKGTMHENSYLTEE